MFKKLPPRHNTAEAIHIICNQRIALLNNLCRHHCAVSLNGFNNIDTRLNRCDAHCVCAFSVRHNCAVKVENSCLSLLCLPEEPPRCLQRKLCPRLQLKPRSMLCRLRHKRRVPAILCHSQ